MYRVLYNGFCELLVIYDLSKFISTSCLMSININFAYFHSCYRTAFYPYFCPITEQIGVPFCHKLCVCAIRQGRLLDRLYSVSSQIQVHHLRSAADRFFKTGLRSRIAEWPASLLHSSLASQSTWWLHCERPYCDKYCLASDRSCFQKTT